MTKSEMREALEECLLQDRAVLKALLSDSEHTRGSVAVFRTQCRQHRDLVELLLTLLAGTSQWFELEEEGEAWQAFQHVLEKRAYVKKTRR